jgi:hypothetical protein
MGHGKEGFCWQIAKVRVVYPHDEKRAVLSFLIKFENIN